MEYEINGKSVKRQATTEFLDYLEKMVRRYEAIVNAASGPARNLLQLRK